MEITRDLTSSIRKSVEVNGLDKTRLLISNVLNEYTDTDGADSAYHCNFCKGELSLSHSISSSLLLYSCDGCDNEIVEYRGTVRTKRRSTFRRGYFPKITIRCFDWDRKERVVECHFRSHSNVTDIEMKSGDKFSITFFRTNNNAQGIQAEIENATIKKIASATVSYDELIQFGESLPIRKNSYLKKLPQDLAPPA